MARRPLLEIALACSTPLCGVFAQDPAALTARDAQALVTRFDNAFTAGDEKAVFELFRMVHREQGARVEERLRTALRGKTALVRKSKVQRSWTLGEHLIALVQSTTSCPQSAQAVDETQLVALRRIDGTPRVTLAVEVDPDFLAAIPESTDPSHPKSIVHCPPCNYAIDAGDEWLMVPSAGQRVGCYESMSFWALEQDLTVMLSIHLARLADDPARSLAALAGELGDGAADSGVQAWIPPRYAAAPRPQALSGATTRFDLLRSAGASEGSCADAVETWLASYGRVSYLFVARGPAVVLDDHRDAIDRLLGSFRLDDPGIAVDVLAARIEHDHLGCRCEAARFTHAASGVRFTAPEGFDVSVAGSFADFDASWCCSAGRPTFRLRGLPPPQGLKAWSAPLVDRMLADTFVRGRLKTTADTGWIAGKSGFGKERTVELAGAADGHPKRIVRVGLDDDLCVVLEVDTTRNLKLAAARAALSGLRRER